MDKTSLNSPIPLGDLITTQITKTSSIPSNYYPEDPLHTEGYLHRDQPLPVFEEFTKVMERLHEDCKQVRNENEHLICEMEKILGLEHSLFATRKNRVDHVLNGLKALKLLVGKEEE